MDPSQWSKVKEAFNAAYDLQDEERADFLNQCDGDLRQEVESLLRAGEEIDGFISEPAVVDLGLANGEDFDLYLGKQIDSYLIVREIGHGGMGTVYLANRTDVSFEKQFALKLIKRGMDTNAVLKRFMMERQILAQLQHPNVANLIDGGTTSDGLPYFVMEYVEGLPVTKFCDERELSINERLALFRSICSVISYAHQNLVVHRDLKPSNIIVTDDGTPKLLDFGIAKLLNPDWSLDTNEATATMFRVMTPEYASPEQIRGLPITTSSDVYSLGVVLYELLCGERPFKIESRLPEEVAQIVSTAEPIRPSSVISGRWSIVRKETDAAQKPATNAIEDPKPKAQSPKLLRGDLDNIVLKAIRKEPERRYLSVQEFSEDIRRHLAGLPVTATADTSFYRFSKFVNRHRVGVFAGGLIFLTLIVATAITTWQAIVARRERDKAEQRFNQVRKLANSVLFEYHDGIAKLAGSTPIREKMVKDALEYLDNLAAENIDDRSLQSELAAAYEKVGDVQGNPFLANLGDQAGALESYRKALGICEASQVSNPDDSKGRFDLAVAHEKIGDMLWAKGESAGAEENYRKALEIYDDLARKGVSPDSYAAARTFTRIGQTQELAGNFDAAVESYQASLGAIQVLMVIEPDNTKYRRGMAIAFTKLGDIFYQQHKYREASEKYNSAFPILRELADAELTDTNRSRTLALILARLALVEIKAADFSLAIEHDRQAVNIQKNIAQVDPNNAQIQYDLADTLTNLGEAFGRKGDINSADAYFREAIATFGGARLKNPEYAQARNHNGSTYMTYAGILLKHGKVASALENYRQARTLLETSLSGEDPQEKLAEVYEGMADAIAAADKSAGTTGEIGELYRKSLDCLRHIEEKHKLNDDDSDRKASVIAKLKKYDAVAARVAQ